MQASDLAARKLAYATSRGIDACANEACGYEACECGSGCTCEVVGVAEAAKVTCDPCREFKAAKTQAKQRRAVVDEKDVDDSGD